MADITGEHCGVTYLLSEPGPTKKHSLWLWNGLIEQFTFERSVHSEQEAHRVIEHLIKDKFIAP